MLNADNMILNMTTIWPQWRFPMTDLFMQYEEKIFIQFMKLLHLGSRYSLEMSRSSQLDNNEVQE